MLQQFQKDEPIPKTASGSGTLRTLGLCLGASTVSVVEVEQDLTDGNPKPARPRIKNASLFTHEGDPQSTLRRALDGINPADYDRVAATGRRFRNFVNLTSISEPEAVEYAFRYVKPDGISVPAVVSAGGETFMVYALDSGGRISNVITGNKCASGTGEFLLQQLRRMDVSLEEAARWAASETPYHVSGRCSVFCKSDCTHATNKGIPKPKVTAGLCKMMAEKILELLKKIDRKNVMVTGGTTRNRMMVQYLEKEIPGLIIPDEAPFFEALGAALWALENKTGPLPLQKDLFRTEATAFDTLPPLGEASNQVQFKTMENDQVREGDVCLLGLDVGSTTTKAVLLRSADNAMLASVYLRTNGDPVRASRDCYREILEQISGTISPETITIEGLGVCGSGRQIAGLHALTDGVINEIIAHAAAAVYFDPDVDTLFEIGGQDAKYTYITNGVPSDYAMNEACSAGTGSFLEESAYETLGVEMEEIGEIALTGMHPPNFNDQCSAFIASDIKNAIHENVKREDIIAGLVYSVCMNYANRVKGNRPVGEKVFMQGGVCYNRAVPLAMATLVGKPIIVPPEPGLMGAFGVALEVKHRMKNGWIQRQLFDLETLMNRDVEYGRSFTCKGGRQKCDRQCEIAMIRIEGKKYPFGGACNRYDNLRRNVRHQTEGLDNVRLRQKLVFETHGKSPSDAKRPGTNKRVGLNRSFLVNTFYPLYSTFFSELGMDVEIPGTPSKEGIDKRNAPFCFPAELAHGFFDNLIEAKPPPDVVFMPHFKAYPAPKGHHNAQVCPFVQGEPFFLKTTFGQQISDLEKQDVKFFYPLIDMSRGVETAGPALIETAVDLGFSRKTGRAAYSRAVAAQKACWDEMKTAGNRILSQLEADPEKMAVVLFGRPYNAYVEEAHMGIPHKLATRGVSVLPIDFLPLDNERDKRHMYWGMGKLLLRAARFVKRHPQLFGIFITNFSCGPDSFLIGYFRDIMGRKPSLTLELDSHTADAGLETRIEAFLDIVSAYRRTDVLHRPAAKQKTFLPARTVIGNGDATVIDSAGKTLPLSDPRVKILFPSMGRLASESVAAMFRSMGLNAIAHPPADEAVLKLGRANTSCKECLPLILTTGTLLNYVQNGRKPGEVLVYFMATGEGPCRFGQYYIFMEDLVRKLELPDIAMLSLTSEDGYGGLHSDFNKRGWYCILISDIMEDIRSMILANAVNVEKGLQVFEAQWESLLRVFEKWDYRDIEHQVDVCAERLGRILMKKPVEEVPRINLTGEIFVRRDELSRQYLTEKLAEKGFATLCTPVAEWLRYTDYLVEQGLGACRLSFKEKIGFRIRKAFMKKYEEKIKKIFNKSALVSTEPIRIQPLIDHAKPYISKELTGEAVLTVGGALHEIAGSCCGVIAIGPFGCMPNRLSESILNEVMTAEVKLAAEPGKPGLRSILADNGSLPFLAIETDGSPFPQLINAKLETFCLRAERLHRRMLEAGH